MTESKISAIPTRFRGVDFRSRLEAKWACMFDLLGLAWTYESIDLQAYIPDFLVESQIWSTPQVRGPVLVEVRPIYTADQYRDPIEKITRSGWRGPAIVVGATLSPTNSGPWGPEYPIGRGTLVVDPTDTSDDWFPVGWYDTGEAAGMLGLGGQRDLRAEWVEAGNRTRWMPSR